MGLGAGALAPRTPHLSLAVQLLRQTSLSSPGFLAPRDVSTCAEAVRGFVECGAATNSAEHLAGWKQELPVTQPQFPLFWGQGVHKPLGAGKTNNFPRIPHSREAPCLQKVALDL